MSTPSNQASWLQSSKGATFVAAGLVACAMLATVAKRPFEPAQAAAPVVAAAVATAPAVAPAQPVPQKPAEAPKSVVAAGTFSAAQESEIQRIMKDYLVKNPEVMIEVQNALEARMEKVRGEQLKVAIAENANEIYRSAAAPLVGNAKGDVTVVEFFDYNCGYCKRALGDLAKLVQSDAKVKVVMKELPILSKGSEEASKVALAAKAQGKYWEVHRALLDARGQLNEATALKIAEKAGLDMTRLKKDMAGDEVKNEIDRVRDLAQKMGIQGTPHFLVGERAIAGAPENLFDQLTKHVAEVRKEGCKVC